MATNITVRLPWHMNGWNGTVCRDPKGNTYCSGRFSYPGDAIATTKDETYEIGCAGKHCGQFDNAAHTAEKKKWYEKHFPGRLIESVEGNDISTQIKKICKDSFKIEL